MNLFQDNLYSILQARERARVNDSMDRQVGFPPACCASHQAYTRVVLDLRVSRDGGCVDRRVYTTHIAHQLSTHPHRPGSTARIPFACVREQVLLDPALYHRLDLVEVKRVADLEALNIRGSCRPPYWW